jgi:ankyrin repeat protein
MITADAIVGFSSPASLPAPNPQCIFDPRGYFYPTGKLPQPFEEFDNITLLETPRSVDSTPGQGLYARGQVYKFDAIKSDAGSFEFLTVAVNGVSYSFSGKFKYSCIFEEFYALHDSAGAIVAEGKLLKLVNGAKVAETSVQLTYSPKSRALQGNVNALYPSGRTELFYAVQRGDLAAIRDLLKRGADINVRDNEGTTPLAFNISSVSDQSKVLAIARMLIAAGAEVNLKDKTETTPLKLAVYQFEDHDGELVKLLLKAGADANAADDYGTTVLMHAVHAANQEAALIKNVRALILAGAQVNARNKLGQTALSIAAEDKNDNLIELLKKAGATR